MATSDTVGAIGSLVIVGASSVFTGKILSLNMTRSIQSIDRTPLDRTSGGMTFEKGRLATWSMTGSMIFAPSGGLPLGTKGQTNLTFADATGTVYRWSTGFITELSPSLTLESGIDADFTLQLNGDYTINPV